MPCSLIHPFLKEMQSIEKQKVKMGYAKSGYTIPFVVDFF